MKLILNLLHSTRIHIRQLGPLKVCNESNANFISNICSQPLLEENEKENHSKTINPFNLGDFENETTSPSNNNEFYLYDFDNVFNFS